jgi:prepilin peptidase CpaA
MLSVLVMLLAVASASDVAIHRIPNALVVGVVAAGALAQVLSGGLPALAAGGTAVVVVAAALWPAWARHWIGGGDLKLAAAIGVWLGITRVPIYLLESAIVAGLLSLVCYFLSARSARAEVRCNLAVATRGVRFAAPLDASCGRIQVPAGAAFAVGGLLALLLGPTP